MILLFVISLERATLHLGRHIMDKSLELLCFVSKIINQGMRCSLVTALITTKAIDPFLLLHIAAGLLSLIICLDLDPELSGSLAKDASAYISRILLFT